MHVISNSFSINMLEPETEKVLLRMEHIEPNEVPRDSVSVVGHENTAQIISGLVGFEVPCNRATFELTKEVELYVAQYTGPRLPEGATELPEGARMYFWKVWMEVMG